MGMTPIEAAARTLLVTVKGGTIESQAASEVAFVAETLLIFVHAEREIVTAAILEYGGQLTPEELVQVINAKERP